MASTSAPGDTELGPEDARRLQAVIGRMSRRLRAGTSGGLTPTELTCLATIVREGPLRANQLASRDAFNPTALSRLVASLEEAGLVTRTPDPDDGRAVVIGATRTGARMVERIGRERAARLVAAVEQLDPADAAGLVDALPSLEALAAALAPIARDAAEPSRRTRP